MLLVPLTPASYRKKMVGQLAQKIQHVTSSLPLLFDGLHRISEMDWWHWTFWLGTVELGASVTVLGAFVLAIRAIRRATEHEAPGADGHAHHGPDWLDVFLGVMLMVEALVHHEETGAWRRSMILLGVVTLVIGIVHGRLVAAGIKRRSLRVTDTGLRLPIRFQPALTASWSEIERIEITPADAHVVTRRGRNRRLVFRKLLRGADVRAALEVAKTRFEEYKDSITHAQTDRSAGRHPGGREQAETN